jgi:RIO kinase 1
VAKKEKSVMGRDNDISIVETMEVEEAEEGRGEEPVEDYDEESVEPYLSTRDKRLFRDRRGSQDSDSEASRRSQAVKKDLQMHKTEGGVFSYATLESVGKLGSEGWIDRIIGPISTGKEADVFLGEREGHKIAIKIFRLSSASYFRNPTVLQYIMGDERFKKIRKSPKDLIRSWAMKEFRNLKKAEEAGISAPKPFAIEKNVLVMQYIGEDEPSQQLLREGTADPEKTFKEILGQMKKMYKSGLVHADLSEYNILMRKGKPVIIDFGQGVLLTHPKADEFLERDARNICAFFKRRGVECDADQVVISIKAVKGKDTKKGTED